MGDYCIKSLFIIAHYKIEKIIIQNNRIDIIINNYKIIKSLLLSPYNN